jgi:hypothetical protein
MKKFADAVFGAAAEKGESSPRAPAAAQGLAAGFVGAPPGVRGVLRRG